MELAFTATPPLADVACTHCALTVPPGLVAAGDEQQFCCHGCRTAYTILHQSGLGAYYDVARQSAARVERARTTGRGYEELDDPTFAALHVKTRADGLCEVELFLEGVHCAACVWVVEKLPLAIPGAAEARLDLGRAVVRVVWEPTRAKLSVLARFLDGIGYPPHVFRGAELMALRRGEDRAMLTRIGVCGAIAGNVMMMAFALYSGDASGMDAQDWSWFRWLSLALTAPALFYGGDVFWKGALAALRDRRLNLDVPIMLGILVAFVSGAVNTLRGAGEIYFDSMATLIFLLLVGRFVQKRGLRRATEAAERLLSLTPGVAHRVERQGTAGSTVEHVRDVPVEALQRDDLVLARAGDTIPADAIVVRGASELNVAWLTGEPRPVPVREGARVEAGAVNLTAPLYLRVLQTGEETRAGKLGALVAESLRRRAPVVMLADRYSTHFSIGMLSLAAVAALVWLALDPSQAVDHAMALLIVTCPCALGMGTPLAIAAAVGRAARTGVLIKGGDALERLSRRGHIWLDKTGTVTEGRITLSGWHDAPAEPSASSAGGISPSAANNSSHINIANLAKPVYFGASGNAAAGGEGALLRGRVRALEASSSHPIARVLAEALPMGGEHEVADVNHVLGGGVHGVVDGHRLAVGAPAFVRERGATIAGWAQAQIDAITSEGATPVVVADNGEVAAVLALSDSLRADARATLDSLRHMGFTVGLLSGDHPAAVRAVARRLGIADADAIGGATPERKLEVVKESAKRGPVAMVGDGVNDAAALSAATVGVAVHGGAEAGVAAADIFLSTPGLAPLERLAVGARRTMRVIRLNFAISVFYNLVGATLAITGVINPLIAAVLMPVSSLTVVFLSYYSRTFQPEHRNGEAP